MKLIKIVSRTLSGYLKSKEPPLFSVVWLLTIPPNPCPALLPSCYEVISVLCSGYLTRMHCLKADKGNEAKQATTD